jgi:hypothetical protein
MLGSGNTASSIASLLGLSQDQTKRATSAAVPSLLAGLTGLASTPQGAERLADTISRQDSGFLDNLTGALSGQGPRLAEQGSGLLGSLMGPGITSKLGGVLSRFTGVGEGATGKLLGMLMPIVLGFLGKQQKSMGLNAGGLANLLSGQKDNIRSAMPAGLESALSSALPGGQLFGGVDTRTAPQQQARSTYQESGYRSEPTTEWGSHDVYADRTRKTGGAAKWALPLLLGLAGLAALLLWSNRGRDRTRETVRTDAVRTDTVRTETPRTAVGAPPAIVSETVTGAATSGGNVVSDTTRLVTQATTTLAGIKDAASAQAALPQLQQINQQLNRLRSGWNLLPESARTSANSALQPQIARLKEAIQPVLNQPGIAETVRPQIDQLVQNINAFSAQ